MNNSTTNIKIPAEFKNICRACRKLNSDMRPIFNYEVNSVQVSQMLSFAITIDVRPDDKLPKSLCTPCLKKLIETYRFFKMCNDSDVEMRIILQNHFNNTTNSIVEKDHNNQQKENLLSSQGKQFVQNNENYIVQIPSHILSDIDNNTHIDVIEYDGGEIKFEEQDYNEFDDFDCVASTSLESKNAEYLKNKKYVDNMSRIWKCNFCDKQFTEKNDLELHEKNHNSLSYNSINKQKSNDSTLDIKSPSDIKSIPPTIFSCTFCKNTFHSWENLTKHIGEHPIKNIYGNVNPCNPSNLNKSLESDNISRNDYICRVDGYINETNSSYKNPEILQLQTIREIPIDIEKEQQSKDDNEADCSKFCCQFCPSQYTLKKSLRNHILCKHKKNISNLEKYECNYCNKLFIKYVDLMRHKKTHIKNKILRKQLSDSIKSSNYGFQCQYCDTKIVYRHNLKRHIANKHPEKNISNEKFTDNNDITKSPINILDTDNINVLSSNLKTNNIECNDYVKGYQCPHCPTVIKSTLTNLRRHINKLHGNLISELEVKTSKIDETVGLEVIKKVKTIKNKSILNGNFKKLIKCEHCELILCSKADVNRHMLKMHKNLSSISLKKYQCMYCGKMFKKYSEMRSHQKHHRKRNDPILTPSDGILKNLSIHTTNTNSSLAVIAEKIPKPILQQSSAILNETTPKFEIVAEKPSDRTLRNSIYSSETPNNFEVPAEKPSERTLRSSVPSTETADNFEVAVELSVIEPSDVKETIDPLKINKGNKSLIPVQCNICQVVLQNIYSYKRHTKQIHGINANEQIDSKPDIKALAPSSNTVQTQSIPRANKLCKYNCSECDKVCVTIWGLRKHNIRYHNDVKYMNSYGLYECNICRKTFFKKSRHNIHIFIHQKKDGIRRKCLICKKISKNAVALRRHYLSAHLNKVQENKNAKNETNNYNCNICSTNFHRSSNYTRHMNTHLVLDTTEDSTENQTIVVKSEY